MMFFLFVALAVAFGSVSVTAAPACNRTWALANDNVYFITTTHPFIYIEDSDVESQYISIISKLFLNRFESYLKTTYTFTAALAAAQAARLTVRSSKIQSETNMTIYVIHINQPNVTCTCTSTPCTNCATTPTAWNSQSKSGITGALNTFLGTGVNVPDYMFAMITYCWDKYSTSGPLTVQATAQQYECPILSSSSIPSLANAVVSYTTRNYSDFAVLSSPTTVTAGKVPIGTYATITGCTNGYAPIVTHNYWDFICGHPYGPNVVANGWNVPSEAQQYCQKACSPLPANATYTVSYGSLSGPYFTNATASVTCATGYGFADVSAPKILTCVDGSWTGFASLGKCVSCCSALPSVANGKWKRTTCSVNNINNGTCLVPGDSIELACDGNFHANGSTTTVCLPDGTWGTNLGTCGCGSLTPTPNHGHFTYSPVDSNGFYQANTIATVTCDTNYTTTTGSTTATCTNGAWVGVGSLSNCTECCETALPVEANGKWSTTTTMTQSCYTPNVAVTLTCNANSAASPAAYTTINCVIGQGWPAIGGAGSNQRATCKSAVCTKLPDLIHGNITYSSENGDGTIPSGSTATVSCIDPAVPSTNPAPVTTATCLSTGQWDTQTLTDCLLTCPPLTRSDTVFEYYPAAGAQLNGAVAIISCAPDFGLAKNGSTNVTCTNGIWVEESDLASCIPCCSGTRPSDGNGQWGEDGTCYLPGDSISLVCDEDFRANSSATKTTTCSPDGSWDTTDLAKCGCPPIEMVYENGTISYIPSATNNAYQSNTIATVECSNGFGLPDPMVALATCVEGQWTATPAADVCKPCCEQPSEPDNGMWNVTKQCHFELDTVNLICSENFHSNGIAVITCQANQTWTDGDSCGCPSLTWPNGTFAFVPDQTNNLYQSNTDATLICDAGFSNSSAKLVALCVNGEWDTTGLSECEKCCATTLPTVENGEWSTTTANCYTSTENITLTCEEGYTPSDQALASIHCDDAEQSWPESDGLPGFQRATCVPVLCDKFSELLYANVTYSNGETTNDTVPFGTTATVTCFSDAAEVPGLISTAICQPDGKWNVSLLNDCQPACPPLTRDDTSFTYYPAGALHLSGAVALASCDEGYGLQSSNGSAFATCTDGSWNEESLAACVPCCSKPPVDVNGVWGDCDNSTCYLPGASISLMCNDDFHISGATTTTTCRDDGSWNTNNLAVCGCKELTQTSGSFVYSPPLSDGYAQSNTIATLSCNSNYAKKDLSKVNVTCVNGEWSGLATLTTCEKCCRTNPPSVGFAQGSWSPSAQSCFSIYESTTLTCDNNTYPLTPSKTSITCKFASNGNGYWPDDVLPLFNPGRSSCAPIICGAIKPILRPYSTVAVTHDIRVGSVATVTCKSNTTPNPSAPSTATCVATGPKTGEWQPSSNLPDCLRCCQAVPTTPNGVWDQLTSFPEVVKKCFVKDDVVSLMCNDGFDANGTKITAKCLSNGKWETGLASCGCPAIETVFTNGTLSYSTESASGAYEANTAVTLICNSGSGLKTPQVAYCINGAWNNTLTDTCEACCNGVPNDKNGEWSSETCSLDNTCALPGDTIVLKCNENFHSNGTTTATCLDDLSWGTDLGTCGCPPINETFINGSLSYSPDTETANGAFEANAVATLICNSGFGLRTPQVAFCINGAWNNSLTDTCEACCNGVPNDKNGEWSSETCSLDNTCSLPGDAIVLKCNENFHSNGTTSATCLDDLSWGTDLGSCGCKELPQMNSSFVYSPPLSDGYAQANTIATLSCDANFAKKDTSKVTVTCVNGEWTGLESLTTCERCCASSPPSVLLAQGSWSPSAQSCFSEYESTTLTCDNNTYPSSSSLTSITCKFASNGNGYWPEDFPFNKANRSSCTPIFCPASVSSLIRFYSTLQASHDIRVGSVATVTCNADATPNPSAPSTATCVATGPKTGKWEPTSNLPDCLPCCKDLPVVANGKWGQVESFPEDVKKCYANGDVVSLLCDDNFHTSGSKTILKCGTSILTPRNWNASGAAKCGCSDLTAPSAANVAGVSYSPANVAGFYESNTIATLKCSTGYAVPATKTYKASCVSGVWNGSFSSSTCLKCCSTTLPTDPVGVWAVTGAVAAADASCNLPTTTITLTCNYGFKTSGAATASCKADGTWGTGLGTCVLKTCTPLTVASGTVTYTNLISGNVPVESVATQKCFRNSRPAGAVVTSTCTNSGWSPATLSGCTPCPDASWTYLAATKKCYKFVNTKVASATAEVLCNNYGSGGHLAAINSATERTAITAIQVATAAASIEYWIGANMIADGTNYFNRDGTPASYLPWGSGEPNKNGEVVVLVGSDNNWYDFAITPTPIFPFMCELPVDQV
uniref:Uncharacterized protein n=1 Tax=Plectus sambesii TaxID=2011161 RepID=A0A914XPG6_9BILA